MQIIQLRRGHLSIEKRISTVGLIFEGKEGFCLNMASIERSQDEKKFTQIFWQDAGLCLFLLLSGLTLSAAVNCIARASTTLYQVNC